MGTMRTIEEIKNLFDQMQKLEQECIIVARHKKPILTPDKWLFHEIEYNYENLSVYVQFEENCRYEPEREGIGFPIEDLLVDVEILKQQYADEQEKRRLKEKEIRMKLKQEAIEKKEKEERTTYYRLKQKYGHTD